MSSDNRSTWGEASQPYDTSIASSSPPIDNSSVYSTESPGSDNSLDTLAGYLAAESGPPRDNTSSPLRQGKSRPDSAVLGVLLSPLTMAPLAPPPVNELLSTQKSSDGLQITLHPLPILEISDHITRSYQRGHKGAIVGALLGQQNGRQITIEYSFTFGAIKGEDGNYRTDPESFIARLDQMRDVHKAPPLDIVGWYTLVPKSGPTQDHLPIHNEILERYNESAILLGLHIEDILQPTAGNPLPLTIYESNLETEDAGRDTQEGEDQQMKDSEAAPKMVLRFRELPYNTETGEAEMIAMQFIREGVAHASRESDPKADPSAGKKGKGKGKGKQPAAAEHQDQSQAAEADEDANLSKDELEQISALRTKSNAIKLMRSRIGLLIDFIQQSAPESVGGDGDASSLQPSIRILRQIQALVTNIELVTPAQQDELEKEILREANDVRQVGVIKDMFVTIGELRDVGKKFAVVEASKAQKTRQSAAQFPEYGPAVSSQHGLGDIGDMKLH